MPPSAMSTSTAIAQAARRSRRFTKEADLLPLAGFLAATAGAAALGTFTGGGPGRSRSLRWYGALRKARGTPPPAVFPAVWTALYAMTAVSGWRVWRRPDSPRRAAALALWTAQLGLNAAWTPLFFGARRPRLAMADLLGLLGTLAAYTAAARRVDAPAAWLTAPYLGWVSYAGYLNAEILRRNPPAWRRALGGR
jgi:tryptophan-rich sensory protein